MNFADHVLKKLNLMNLVFIFNEKQDFAGIP